MYVDVIDTARLSSGISQSKTDKDIVHASKAIMTVNQIRTVKKGNYYE